MTLTAQIMYIVNLILPLEFKQTEEMMETLLNKNLLKIVIKNKREIF